MIAPTKTLKRDWHWSVNRLQDGRPGNRHLSCLWMEFPGTESQFSHAYTRFDIFEECMRGKITNFRPHSYFSCPRWTFYCIYNWVCIVEARREFLFSEANKHNSERDFWKPWTTKCCVKMCCRYVILKKTITGFFRRTENFGNFRRVGELRPVCVGLNCLLGSCFWNKLTKPCQAQGQELSTNSEWKKI